MNLLAIDTTGRFSSVCLAVDDTFLFRMKSQEMSHLSTLVPMVEELLAEADIKKDELTHIAVSAGPGSFTGIRIGVATARAMSFALSLSIIYVPTLKSFLWNDENFDGLVCPIFDARRDQVYTGIYQKKEEINEILDDSAFSIEELINKIAVLDSKEKIKFFGDGLEKYSGKIIERFPDKEFYFADEKEILQSAVSVAKYSKFMIDKNISFLEKPIYLRKSEAERKLTACKKTT